MLGKQRLCATAVAADRATVVMPDLNGGRSDAPYWAQLFRQYGNTVKLIAPSISPTTARAILASLGGGGYEGGKRAVRWRSSIPDATACADVKRVGSAPGLPD